MFPLVFLFFFFYQICWQQILSFSPENVLILPLSLKDIFPGYGTVGEELF